MATFYKEFFQPKVDYRPVMTKEGINETPETWLSFYPHKTFVLFHPDEIELCAV